jgi:hypothetical protein
MTKKVISIIEDLIFEDINNEDYWKAVAEAKDLIKKVKAKMYEKELVVKFIEKLDYSYNYKTTNERDNIIKDICDIAGIEQLTIPVVSNRRELLLAYHKHLDSFNDPSIYNATENMIDDYLANNCG